MDAVLIIVGLALAIAGAHLLIGGGVSIAQRLGIPTIIIGSTVVAFGTSMPELTVNMHAAAHGNTELALGNIIGSNVFNICLIIGVSALITPLVIDRHAAMKDLPMCLLSAVMIGVCGNELYLDHINYHELMLSHGIIFLSFFAIFAYYTYLAAVAGIKEDKPADTGEDTPKRDAEETHSLGRAIVYVVLGLVALAYGGDRVVVGTAGLAKTAGISDRIIGLLIVGPGTSLPELLASVVAARKKQSDMVIGNILGSNIFNVFFTLGLTACILPVPLDLALNYAVIANIAVSLFLVLFVCVARRKPIGRVMGVILLVIYGVYIAHMLGH